MRSFLPVTSLAGGALFPSGIITSKSAASDPDASGLFRLVAVRTRNTLHACPPHASCRPVVRIPSGLGAHPPSEPPLVPALRARIPDAVPWRCPAPPSEADARSSLPTLTDTLHEPLPLSESWRKGGLAARFANGRDSIPDAAQIHRAKMAAVVSGAGLPLTGKGSCMGATHEAENQPDVAPPMLAHSLASAAGKGDGSAPTSVTLMQEHLLRAVAAAAAQPGEAKLPPILSGLTSTWATQSSSAARAPLLASLQAALATERGLNGSALGSAPPLSSLAPSLSSSLSTSCSPLGTRARSNPSPVGFAHQPTRSELLPPPPSLTPLGGIRLDASSRTNSLSPRVPCEYDSPAISPFPDSRLRSFSPVTTPRAQEPPLQLPPRPPLQPPSTQPLQMLQVLPGDNAPGTMPRIANLKSGCTDGLMLLSATATLVARDTAGPAAKKPKII